MVPSSIKHDLAGLRYRERLLTLVWGAACWLSIVLVLLALCGLVDWLIDRQRETPFGVRVGLFALQVAAASVAGLLFVFWPQVRRLPDTLLALWVEGKIPQFQHRLISAVQLNQPGAKLDGMSKELVGVVTREAEKMTQGVGGFAQVADHSRLKWTGFVLVPVLILFALPFAIWPGLCFALLARQALMPVDVPHSVELESASKEVWPVGDKIKLYFRVTGEYRDSMVGSVHVRPEGQPADSYPLTFVKEDAKGAIFEADVAPSSTNILYSARLADGRTKAPSEMRLVSRPVVFGDEAFVRLPAFCGLKPARPGMNVDDRRYETLQGKGDIAGIAGSSVRVQFEVGNLKHKAWLVLFEREKLDPEPAEGDGPPPREKETIKMVVKNSYKMKSVAGVLQRVDVVVAEAAFDLAPGLAGFRLMVEDENGFKNVQPPWRSVALEDEGKPTVRLLRENFSDLTREASFEVDGLPVVLGERIRISYECSHKYGLGRARIWYRVLKKQTSGENPEAEFDWTKSNLVDEPANPGAGRFNTKTGVFERTKFDQEVQFHAVPSPFPDLWLGRTEGGGRAFLPTDGLVDHTYKPMRVKYGDLIEYCIEVFANDHDKLRGSLPPSARSETRVSEVMSFDDLLAWHARRTKIEQNLKDIEAEQNKLFGAPK